MKFFPHSNSKGMETALLFSVCRLDTSKFSAISVTEVGSCKSFPGKLICGRQEKVRLPHQRGVKSLTSAATV